MLHLGESVARSQFIFYFFFLDLAANVLRTNIEQIYGGYPSLDGCPLAEGDIADIGDGTMFIGLQNYQQKYNSPYKLCFGPKSFLVISDPVQIRHILRDANNNYDKGVLAEILKPIMVIYTDNMLGVTCFCLL